MLGCVGPIFVIGTDEVNVKDYDFTALDVSMPYPDYAQYHFICVLAPSEETFEKIRALLAEAYDIAARRYASQNKTIKHETIAHPLLTQSCEEDVVEWHVAK